jgi:hypothetical protein
MRSTAKPPAPMEPEDICECMGPNCGGGAGCPAFARECIRRDTVRIKAHEFTRNPDTRVEHRSIGGLVGKSSGCRDRLALRFERACAVYRGRL